MEKKEEERVAVQDDQARVKALLAYWVIFLVVGVPIWWATTKIERHPLPVQQIDHLIKTTSIQPIQSSPDSKDAQAAAVRVKGYPGYQISFTVISQTDHCVNLHPAYTRHFASLLSALSTQIAYFKVDLQCRLQAVPAGTGSGTTLSSFVRSEWYLANSISSLPIINFIVYMDEEWRRAETSFVYPQWGAVHIYSGSGNRNSSSSSVDEIMLRFKRQLLQLIGVEESENMKGLDIDGWLRKEELRCRTEAIGSLRSLLHIINSNPNMPVPRQVSLAVNDAVRHIQLSLSDDDTLTQTERYGLARNGLDAAEAAFFHPAMLARQYFPQEHVLAVYVPLFVPLLMPLVVQTVKTLRA
jgi:phosphatidylinositol glycan class S